MKRVEAIIRPEMLGAVKTVLEQAGCHGMTVTEVKGMGRQKGHTDSYRGVEYAVDFQLKLKVEVVTSDDLYYRAVRAITHAAATDQPGDGKIFVSPILDAVRIRTGETGLDTLVPSEDDAD